MSRFSTAQDGPKPTSEQLAAQQLVQKLVVTTARNLEDVVTPGRELSLALTKLEEALMWAGKAIFADPVKAQSVAPDDTRSILATVIPEDNALSGDAATVGGYLAALLETLLAEEEGFSGKRPLGSSGWGVDLEEALGGENVSVLYPAIRAALT